ncbi:MAG: fused MFS/spermidine synthase [Nitratireductor sp.]|nr:fused MFS/spermidine synthase [Nitratireductor sp.]
MSEKADARTSLAVLVILQAMVSAASLVVEIVAGRMLAPYLGMSLYTWTSVIAVVLAGFSAGHWVGGLIAARDTGSALRLTAWSMAGAAITTASAVLLLRLVSGPVISGVAHPVGAIVVLTSLVFFLPSFFAGIPAPVLSHVAVSGQPDRSGPALGAMFAAGALGAIFGTLAAGFVFISWLGSVRTLSVVAGIYVLVAAGLFALSRPGSIRGFAALVVAMVATGAISAGTTGLSDPCTRESQYFCIRILDASAEARAPARVMVLDHLGHGISVEGEPGRLVTAHAALLDSLARLRMNGKPFSSYFIGGGSYTIPRAWSAEADVVSMTVAEIDPVVTELAISRMWFDPGATRIVHEDARMLLAREENRYDVIIIDAFTDIAVPAHLVTREFFEIVRSRLRDDGVYLMNVVDHFERLRALSALTRTLREVFPVVEIWAERQRPQGDERAIFVVLAGSSQTRTDIIDGPEPDRHKFGRLPQVAVDTLIARIASPVLTDDYAPIDRLMGRLD